MSINQSTIGCKKVIVTESVISNINSNILSSVDLNSTSVISNVINNITSTITFIYGNIIDSITTLTGNSITITNFTVPSNLQITSTDPSSSVNNGSILLSGGLAISKTTDSISSINGGTITTAGGVSIGKKLIVGETITSPNNQSGRTLTGCVKTYGVTDTYSSVDLHSKNINFDARFLCTLGSSVITGEGILTITSMRMVNNNPLLIIRSGADINVAASTAIYPSDVFWSGTRTGRGNVSTSTTTDLSKTLTYSGSSRIDLNHDGLYYYSILVKGYSYGGGGSGTSDWNDMVRYIVVETGTGEINSDNTKSGVCKCDGLYYLTSAPGYIKFHYVTISSGFSTHVLENDPSCKFAVTLLS